MVRGIWILASVNWAVMSGGLPPVGGKPPNPLSEMGAFGLRVSIVLLWGFFRVALVVKTGNWG